MNNIRIAFIVLACLPAVGCVASVSEEEAEAVAVTAQALDVTKTGSLTRKQGGLLNVQNEGLRQQDTIAYYNTVRIGANGTSGDTITVGLPTLARFITNYGFAGNEVVTRYYNRGDLGIGREMHCVNKLSSTGEIACYVTNFAAGADGSDMTFGQSPNNAFNNMNANHPFATVAMAYRNQMAANAPNKVYFVVFGATGSRINAAALDRVGVLAATNGAIPGVNYNNHIPSNCAACHGGLYDNTAKTLTGGLFLPFDLDQFEYQNVAGQTRAAQEPAFRTMNLMVREVAARNGPAPVTPITNLIDGWYAIGPTFDSLYVPPGWLNFTSTYRSIARPLCRACHVTNSLPFNTESQFRTFMSQPAPFGAVHLMCTYQMPHALQTVREFWLSTQKRNDLDSYLRNIGQPALADTLKNNCSPGNVATLDPQFIAVTQPYDPVP